MERDLYMFFPQWQGSGPSDDLWAAAQALRRELPSILFQEVPVSLEPIRGITNGVQGGDAIQRQLMAQRRFIEAASPERIFTLGGDCSVEIVPVSWLNERCGGSLAVIWLDAHGDLNSPSTSASHHFHGMPLRFLLSDGGRFSEAFQCSRLAPSQVALAGVRELDPPEAHFIQESGIPVFDVGTLEADPGSPARWALRQGLRDIYLHLDLDVLEPAEFPHLKCPSPGGLRVETLLSVIGSLKRECQVAGFSVLEFTRIQSGRGLADVKRILEAGIGDWLP